LAGVTVGFFYAVERPGLAAAFLVVCGTFDILDGKVAKNGDRKSLFGAILDSSLDRYTEFFIYTGLAYHFRHGWGLWLMFFAFLGSMMVSYTRARAEGLGVDCQVGIMQRAERFVLLFLGTVAGIVFGVLDPAILVVMVLIAVISNVTAVQRIFYVKRYEKRRLSKEG
jgi:CDP-diacylglycerol--glycerol-3-phosphate 3-phosphatidyltransferase